MAENSQGSWPYINDYLDVRWIPLPLAREPSLWISVKPPAGAGASACTCHLYYRLTPAIYLKFVAAIDKLAAVKENRTAGVVSAASVLVDLGTWLVNSSGEYTAADLAAAYRAATDGAAQPVPKSLATRDELRAFNQIIARDAAANARQGKAFDSDEWLKSWGR